ncbi:MAG: 4Fe-4S dicluster domain-containing protein, partial [Caldilineae bacterium]
MDIPLLQERFGGRAPQVRAESCLNARHRHADCTRCVDACAPAAIALEDRLPELDPDLCVHCGACVATCPTDVFSQLSPPEKTLALTFEQLPGAAPLELICSLVEPAKTTHAPVAARVQHRRCLAALTPEQLLTLSGDGARPLWLDDSACAACPLHPAHAVIRASVATVNGLLAAVGRTPSLALHTEDADRLLDEPIQRPVLDGMRPQVSRRGFFGALRKMAEDRVEQALEEEPAPMLRAAAPVDQRLPRQLPPSRKRLLDRLARLASFEEAAEAPLDREVPLAGLPFAAVHVDPAACSGCG